MKVAFRNEQFTVIDDFLPEVAWQQVWRWFQVAPFFPNDIQGLRGAWRLDDGRVMRGPDVYYGGGSEEAVATHPNSFAYPTGTGLDLLIEYFNQNIELYAPLVGYEGRDWYTMAAAPRLYERGSSLYWHRDTPAVVTGSCTYYAHPYWNAMWGGELYIAHPEARNIPEEWGPSLNPPQEVMGQGMATMSAHLDNSAASAALMETGMGYYVAPKPNRLVVMQTGNPHMINKVAMAAGDHVRASVTMFLIRPGHETTGGNR